jgi:hypothetical protein
MELNVLLTIVNMVDPLKLKPTFYLYLYKTPRQTKAFFVIKARMKKINKLFRLRTSYFSFLSICCLIIFLK